MRPPESAPDRTRDVVRGIGLGVMQAMTCGPSGGRARPVEHLEKNQHSARPWIERYRAMRERAMIADGGAEAADEDQRDRACQYAPSGARVEDQSDRGADMNQSNPE